MRSVKKTRVKLFSTEFFDWIRQSEFTVEKVESKKPFCDCVRKPDLGFNRKRPFSTDHSDCTRNGLTTSAVSSTNLGWVLIFARWLIHRSPIVSMSSCVNTYSVPGSTNGCNDGLL